MSLSALDFAASLFGGYDWWIGPQWSLGLAGAASAGTAVELTDSNGKGSGYGVTPYAVMLEGSLLFH